MKHYNFTEFDKIIIADMPSKDCTAHLCEEHGVYLKIEGISNFDCPWCGKSHDPIQDIREYRKKFKKEVAL